MGDHIAAARSGRIERRAADHAVFRVFSNKMENVFPRNEADVVPRTFRGAQTSVCIKDKYSWLPLVPRRVALAQWEAI